jgi:hypothetical protein
MKVSVFEYDATGDPGWLEERINAVVRHLEAEGKGVLDVQVSYPPHDRNRDPQAVHIIVKHGTPHMPDNSSAN